MTEDTPIIASTPQETPASQEAPVEQPAPIETSRPTLASLDARLKALEAATGIHSIDPDVAKQLIEAARAHNLQHLESAFRRLIGHEL